MSGFSGSSLAFRFPQGLANSPEGNVIPTKASATAPLCRFFNTPRGCNFGSLCRNKHVARSGLASRADATDESLERAGLGFRAGGVLVGERAVASASVCRYYAAGEFFVDCL